MMPSFTHAYDYTRPPEHDRMRPERRRARLQMIGHVIQNIVTFPSRTVPRSWRAMNPKYRVQWEADRAINRWNKERRRALESVPGTSTSRECRLLAHLVSKSPAGGCVVEIGAFKGKTTAWLVEAAQLRPDRP